MFEFLRLTGALLVWYGICQALSGKEAALAFTPYQNIASLGMAIFAIISGYFITQSCERQSRLIEFVINRAVRVFGAMLGMVLICICIVGPFATTLGLGAYFTHPDTWGYFKSLWVFTPPRTLPGVFTDLPNHAVNGTLVMLAPLLRCYLVIAVLGGLGILNTRMLLLWLCTMLCVLVIDAIGGQYKPEAIHNFSWSWLVFNAQWGLLFCGGALIYMIRSRLPRHIGIVTGCILLALFSTKLPGSWGVILLDAALIYVVIYIGFLSLPILEPFALLGDYAYGIVLYAFPATQLCLHLLGRPSSIMLLVASLLMTVCFAFLSWNLVEKRLLRWKY